MQVVLAPYRDAYCESARPAVVVPHALSSALLAPLRARLAALPARPYALAHRARYHELCDPREPVLVSALRELAERVTGASLKVLAQQWLLFRRGDYLMKLADPWRDESAVELTADLSAGSSSEAQVVYVHRGTSYFAMPQLAGAVAVVARQPGIERYDRYLSHRMGDRSIYRLRLLCKP